jgi:hypothetical protein
LAKLASNMQKPIDQRDTHFSETQDTAFFIHSLDAFWRDGLALLPQPKALGMVLHGLVPVAMHTRPVLDAPTAHADAVAYGGLSKLAPKPLPLGDYTRHHAPIRIAFNRMPDWETEV